MKLGLLFSASFLLMAVACTKTDNTSKPVVDHEDSTAIMGFADSTLLIKTMQYVNHLSSPGFTDSGTNYYYYDTVKRQITINEKGLSQPGNYSYDNTETFTYNSDGLLINYHVPNAYLSNIDYTYDADKVLSSISTTFENSPLQVINFTKTNLPSGGFQLDWVYAGQYRVTVDANRKLLKYYTTYASVRSDTVIYDDAGNVRKVLKQYGNYPDFSDPATSFTLYDYPSRATGGDQVYNLLKVLNNGIFYIPGTFADIFNQSWLEESVFQVTKNPVLSSTVTFLNPTDAVSDGAYNIDSVKTIPAIAQLDNSNRLISCQVYVINDVLHSINSTDYHITYYK